MNLLGPDLTRDSLDQHIARYGTRSMGSPGMIELLQQHDLRGRGGANFPAWRKWLAVREHAASWKNAVVVVNGGESDPLSQKDATLMELRPHLVLEGAAIAAETVLASEVFLYINRKKPKALDSMRKALREHRRGRVSRVKMTIVEAPGRYVSSQEWSAVRHINGGPAKPLFSTVYPAEHGVGGRPTLVSNVETIASSALLARSNAVNPYMPSRLFSVMGAVGRPGVMELASNCTLSELIIAAGGVAEGIDSVLLGGYAGKWHRISEIYNHRLDGSDGISPGCGSAVFMPLEICGLEETAKMLRFLAGESAQQCGACIHGLAAISEGLDELLVGRGSDAKVDRLLHWCGQLATGRGACHHPDGTSALLRSALVLFAEDLTSHVHSGFCAMTNRYSVLREVAVGTGWR